MSETLSRRGVPKSRGDDLVRAHLVDSLARRWDHQVTTVVAGPGFGKSTTIAQAVRENQVHPVGLDLWLSCEPIDADGRALVKALAELLGIADQGVTVAQVGDAIRARSPMQVCLVLDDVHHVPPDSAGAEALSDLVRQLPVNGHVLLASRVRPPVPLTRLRSQGEVIDVTQEDLSFTSEEATIVGGADAAQLGGWPALVRLGAADTTAGAVEDYVWEEVLPDLDPSTRSALLTIVLAGPTDQELLDAVLGERSDIDELLRSVPLLSWHDDGRVRAHDLWELILQPQLVGPEADDLRRRVVEALLMRREWSRSFDLAIALGDDDLVARAIRLAVVRKPSVSFGLIAARWWELLSEGQRTSLEGTMLRALAICGSDSRDARGLAAFDDAIERLREEGDGRTEGAMASIRLAVAFVGRDIDAVMRMVERASELDAAGAMTDHGYRLYQVMFADLAGNLGEAAEILDAIDLSTTTNQVRHGVERMRTNIYVLVGRAPEAAEAGRRLVALGGESFHNQMWASAEWFAGNPDVVFEPGRAAGVTTENEVDTTAFWIYYTLFAAHSATAAPRMEVPVDGRDTTLIGLANAGLAINDGDEHLARRDVAEILEQFPLGSDGRSMGELVRLLPRAYVLSDEIRAHFDGAELTPWSERNREVARQFLDLRGGRPVVGRDVPDARQVVTMLPAAWVIEFACRLVDSGHPAAVDVAREWLLFLGEAATVPVHDRLRALLDDDVESIRKGAAALLAQLPEVPAHSVHLDVLGTMRLSRDEVDVEDADWRRARVRELIALVALEGPLSRERVMDRLWPDMDSEKAANNLRVNLSKARRLFEPDRPNDVAPFVLRQFGEQLSLAGPPVVDVDIERFRSAAHRAAEADGRGEVGVARDAYEKMVETVDTDNLLFQGFGEWADGHRHQVEVALLRALNRCGELMLADGRHERAAELARRALRRDPYDEASHRLLAAALLQSGDRTAAVRSIAECREMLNDLGLPESPETAMLSRLVATAL